MSVAVTSFAVFAVSQIGTPGPANMALLATGARFGFRAALPFVAGVALGKQLVIWPVGFGLMAMADRVPGLFEVLKYASAAILSGWPGGLRTCVWGRGHRRGMPPALRLVSLFIRSIPRPGQ